MEKKKACLRLRSKFITLEGTEGTGKSTQARLLARFLENLGSRVMVVRDPGSTLVGEKIRSLLLDPENKAMSSLSETLLYMAARKQLVEELILPALKEGKAVIADRFLDATRAYQGFGGGVDGRLIEKLGRLATGSLVPHLTILLDVGLRKGLRRAGRGDRVEQKPLGYHRKVKKGYLELARLHPGRIKMVTVRGTILQTQKALRRVVLRHFGLDKDGIQRD